MSSSFHFSMIGLMYIILGVPLVLDKIKRNSFYGFRTEKTLSDDKYWFPVNKVTGKWFVAAGIAIVLASYFVAHLNLSEESQAGLMVIVLVVTTCFPVVFGFRKLKQIS